MAVTMKDIALASGVSRPMVSLVLNGRAEELRIAENTKKRVLETAEKLGYCRNQLALSVVTGQSRILAFVTADMGLHNYTGRIQEGILNAVSKSNYSVKLYHLNGSTEKLVRNLKEWQVAGVIFHVSDYKQIAEVHKELDKLKIPVALVNLRNRGRTGFGITTDDKKGAYDATLHLIKQGAKKVVCLFYGKMSEYVSNRIEGYLQAIKESGLNPFILEVTGKTEKEIEEMVSGRIDFDAVFCISDTLAMLVMRHAMRKGIKIPEELKISGFGDLDMADYAAVSLTSVQQDYGNMGETAATAVIKAIENKHDPLYKKVINEELPTRLIIRESS